MQEIELKFQVPRAQQAAVRRAVATPRSVATHLQAIYFDTPDRRLAAAGLAFRLRKEGARWVQTLKGRGDGLMQRLEHEVQLPRSRAVPSINPALHADSPAGQSLARVIAASPLAIGPMFATDIRRTHRIVRLPGGTQIELAFDEGEIRAGEARLPVCELEFELLRGAASALPALASRWVDRHGLWLDVRSKAERGDRLARGIVSPAAVKSSVPALMPKMSGQQALRAMLATALNQVLSNACEIGDGGSAEHLHQCRVGLRRLRCVLRDFAWLADDPSSGLFDAWSDELAGLFRRLGSARDRDVLAETLLPVLVAAGAPPLDALVRVTASEDAGDMLREPAVSRLWLALLAWSYAPLPPSDGSAEARAGDPTAKPPLVARLRKRLRRLHRQVAADAAGFGALEEAAQHRVRKRLKRLRYGLEFCAALLARKDVRRRIAVLSPAQEALGNYTNLLLAKDSFEARLPDDPRAWFALGWLAARREGLVTECTRALVQVAALRRF